MVQSAGYREDGRRQFSGEDFSSKNEARYIMEEFLGHELSKDQVVHHKNEDPTDDRLKNLEIMTHEEHMELHNSESNIAPWKKERIMRMAREMDEVDIGFLSKFSGESREEIRILFSHIIS